MNGESSTMLANDSSEGSIVSLASRLIACPSITPKDAGAQQILARQLELLGFTVKPIIDGESCAFWAELISSDKGAPLLAFSGHTDVVPPGDLSQWTSDPFTPAIRDGYLYGRGMADMKGNIASFMVAIEEFLKEAKVPPSISLGVMIAGDEEGAPNCGTANIMKYLQASGRTLDYCIVSEPTSVESLGDTVKNGRRGSVLGEISVQGIQGHSAYPERAKNPIHIALQAFEALTSYDWDLESPNQTPKTTLQFTSIHSDAGASNVIPGSLSAVFNIRYPLRIEEEVIRNTVHSILSSHGLSFSISWDFHAAPFLTSGGKLLETACRVIKELTDISTTCSSGGGTSDARFIAPFCKEVLELGLVGSSMHAINEHAKIADLVKLKDIYKRIVQGLQSQTPR